MIRVVLPHHLRNLAGVGAEVSLEINGAVTVDTILDALESKYPMLKGTIRDHVTKKRRDFLRYFACAKDISFEPTDASLPNAIAEGKDQFYVIGAIAGG